MLKKLLIATAAGGLMMSTALAQQTAPSPSAPAASPPAASPATPTMDDKAKADSAAAVMKDGKFVGAQNADQWAWSKFKGTDVIGPDNAKIGDVDDVLFDKEGKVHALIVGVGGFLGIGQKDVAIEMSAFQVVPADSVRTTARDTGTTGTTAPAPAAAVSDPTDIKLKVSWTKDQLKEAPAFAYYKAPARTTGSAPGTAPRPAGAPAGSTTR